MSDQNQETRKMTIVKAAFSAQNSWRQHQNEATILVAQEIANKALLHVEYSHELEAVVELKSLLSWPTDEDDEYTNLAEQICTLYKKHMGVSSLSRERFEAIVTEAFKSCWQRVLYESNADLDSNEFEAEVNYLDADGKIIDGGNNQATAIRVRFREASKPNNWD